SRAEEPDSTADQKQRDRVETKQAEQRREIEQREPHRRNRERAFASIFADDIRDRLTSLSMLDQSIDVVARPYGLTVDREDDAVEGKTGLHPRPVILRVRRDDAILQDEKPGKHPPDPRYAVGHADGHDEERR